MKIDPHKHKERYAFWKEQALQEGIQGLSKEDSDLLLKYILDMELGLNVSLTNKKGSRSYIRLNTIRQRMVFLAKQFYEYYSVTDLSNLSEFQLHDYFSKMRNGTIKRGDGSNYKSTADYVKVFKAFWHWFQKTSRKKGVEVDDITIDLDTSREKPQWVYLDESQIKMLYDHAKYEYKVLIMFLFDTGIRAPTELMNIKVSDFLNDCKELNIRDEASKTFGRRIKLMICSDMIKEFIVKNDLRENDFVFQISPPSVNQYLRRLAERILGNGKSLAGQKYSELTMYDFRHCSCCYWFPRYKSESALKFRFGWKKSDRIHYYSEMLGMRDTIQEEDMLVDVTKTELEKRLTKAEHNNDILRDENKLLNGRIERLEAQLMKLATDMQIIYSNRTLLLNS